MFRNVCLYTTLLVVFVCLVGALPNHSRERRETDTTKCYWYDARAQYQGTVSVTLDGVPCLPWEAMLGTGWYDYDYPENYCRQSTAGYRPWCYTFSSWNYCDIPVCEGIQGDNPA